MKTKESKKTKSRLILVGFFLVFIGFIILALKFGIFISKNAQEDKSINNFKEKQEIVHDDITSNKEDKEDKEVSSKSNNEEYIALLEIPKIKLEKGLYDIKSSLNNVDENIQILKESDMPNVENGNMILVGHSGSGSKAYFSNLVKLDKDDIAIIIYNKKKYSYKLIDKYEIEKTGKTIINSSLSTKTLTLITCKENTNKQIVFIFEEIEESDYIE